MTNLLQQLVKILEEESRNCARSNLVTPLSFDKGSVHFCDLHMSTHLIPSANSVCAQFKKAKKMGIGKLIVMSQIG